VFVKNGQVKQNVKVKVEQVGNRHLPRHVYTANYGSVNLASVL
jgi:hypothetical protein